MHASPDDVVYMNSVPVLIKIQLGDKMLEMRINVQDFVNIAFKEQTYMNILYLLFSFPLGAAYFTFFVTVFSLGLGSLLMWVGIALIVIVLMAWRDLISFERQMVTWLLDVNIPDLFLSHVNSTGLFDRFIYEVRDPVMWRSLFFLLLKFPLGFFSIIVVISLATLTFGMLLSPFLYILGGGLANSFLESLLMSVAGIFAGILSMHLLNHLAYVEGLFAEKMLNSGNSACIETNFIADV